jgi:hypothetical protein
MYCAAAAAAIGCGGSGSDGMPDAAGPAQRTLTVHGLIHYFGAKGETTAVLGNAVDSRTVVRDAAGKFHGFGVPTADSRGDFALRFDDGVLYLAMIGDFQYPQEFVVDPVDGVDVGSLHVGRQGSPVTGSRLSLGGGGLLAWRSGDQLAVTVPNMDFTRFPTGGAPTLIAMGATMFAPTAIDGLDPPISAALGDALWVLQQRRDIVGDVTYDHFVRALVLAGIEQTGGATIDATGTFVAPAADQLDLDVRLSQFAALPGVDPAHLGAIATVNYQPFGAPRGFGTITEFRELVRADLSKVAGDTQLALPFGNPFPPAFALVAALDVNAAAKDYALPSTQPLRLSGGFHVEAPLAEAEATPLVPTIGPVSGLLVDGTPAGPGAHPSLAPTLSWQAPALGHATGYVVDVLGLSLETGGAFTRLEQVARFFTVSTQLAMPPNMLTAGHKYFYQVTAVSGGLDVRAAPHEVTGAYATSRTLSDPFTP